MTSASNPSPASTPGGECPPLTGGAWFTPRAAFFGENSICIPSDLGAAHPLDAACLTGFVMLAFVADHPFIVGLFVAACALSLVAAFVRDGHWSQPLE